MAAYCELADIIKIIPEADLIQLTDDEGNGTVNTARVDTAISEASNEIDAWIGGKCKLPLETVPPVVKSLAARMAAYNVHMRRPDAMPEEIKERNKAAMKTLEAFAAGKITLGIQPIPDAPEDGGYSGGPLVAARPKEFRVGYVKQILGGGNGHGPGGGCDCSGIAGG